MIAFALLQLVLALVLGAIPSASVACGLFAVAWAFAAAHQQRTHSRTLWAMALACVSAALVFTRTLMPDVGAASSRDYGLAAMLMSALLLGVVVGYGLLFLQKDHARARARVARGDLAKRVRLWKDSKGAMRVRVE